MKNQQIIICLCLLFTCSLAAQLRKNPHQQIKQSLAQTGTSWYHTTHQSLLRTVEVDVKVGSDDYISCIKIKQASVLDDSTYGDCSGTTHTITLDDDECISQFAQKYMKVGSTWRMIELIVKVYNIESGSVTSYGTYGKGSGSVSWGSFGDANKCLTNVTIKRYDAGGLMHITGAQTLYSY